MTNQDADERATLSRTTVMHVLLESFMPMPLAHLQDVADRLTRLIDEESARVAGDAARQALLDAADAHELEGTYEEHVADWLRARAEQETP